MEQQKRIIDMLLLVREFIKRLAAGPADHIASIKGNPTVLGVQLGVRTIDWLYLGLNHWSVLVKLSNGQWVCIQFHTTGAVTADVFDCEQDAALHTCPRLANKVRLADYGTSNRLIYWSDIVAWIQTQQGGRYIFGLKDCQNFSRKMIGWLTGKWVGVWPRETCVTYSPKLSDDAGKCCTASSVQITVTVRVTENAENDV